MKLINTSSEFKYKYIIFTILIVLFASVKTSYLFADRLLIGIDSQHNSYLKGRGGYFQTCKPDSEKVTKTGDFVRGECGEGGDTGKTYPNVSLEINFGEPSQLHFTALDSAFADLVISSTFLETIKLE